MVTTRRRVEKLEDRLGANAFERWLKSCSDEELDARIYVIDQKMRAALAGEGIDCTDLTATEVCAIVGEFETNGGHRPTRFENNQEIS